ncbi:hypothetical protein [Paenilisteria weihenstephanensis]|uniref:hypothetical protein n=1 Tax=Listeria weihenstephanensis TaxID=1006155 RepID=UPI001E3FEEBF|nr:hypothetical protein [Listeria weihenstephanensis]
MLLLDGLLYLVFDVIGEAIMSLFDRKKSGGKRRTTKKRSKRARRREATIKHPRKSKKFR